MAQKPAVHIELRGEEWAVVREGNRRATSVHPTQSEAAEIGRDLARRDGTEFFLHGQDGQVREHRDYGEGETPADPGILDTVSETVGSVTDLVGDTTGVVAQATGRARQNPEAGAVTDRRSGERESDLDVGSSQESSSGDETGGLAGEQIGTPEERYAEYGVFDQYGERIGQINDLFVDELDEPEYVGVGMGLPENRSVLIPAEAITVDDRLRRMVVSHPRSLVETAPSLGYAEEVTPEFERRVRIHYGLDTEERAGYGAYYPGEAGPQEVTGADPVLDLPEREEDDVRVRRSEEELRVETREREAGEMRVRKRVRTERERLTVPKKRVEVSVERVPVEGEEAATAPQIGEEEIVVPVVEEEIVVEKRPVVKEEIRIRKQVIEDVEVVEEDVRKEEVEIVEETGHTAGSTEDTERDDR
jgi:uncharacterized protein (TIGR02271 family)